MSPSTQEDEVGEFEASMCYIANSSQCDLKSLKLPLNLFKRKKKIRTSQHSADFDKRINMILGYCFTSFSILVDVV